jgi:hypothetical protein
MRRIQISIHSAAGIYGAVYKETIQIFFVYRAWSMYLVTISRIYRRDAELAENPW